MLTMILLCQLDQTYRHRVKYNQSSSLSPEAESSIFLFLANICLIDQCIYACK